MRNILKTAIGAILAIGLITGTAEARSGFGGGGEHFVPHSGGFNHNGGGFVGHPGFADRGFHSGFRGSYILPRRVYRGFPGPFVGGYSPYPVGPCVYATWNPYRCGYYGYGY